eukprot:CAMPEP_0114522790 /NCGR_PEP_ID=MMETSP0109-20121206/20933_1 /TAXON_ID=29199 /ORGANISM="Chlorarachnion reptans, Strain CCCM449" /LENGTH=252 /DNA_ID=CAMNT_0001704037 /DNA_START=58 /DNA_END=816 /DNA_ORIENTATION=+
MGLFWVLAAALAVVFLFMCYFGFLHTPRVEKQEYAFMDTIPIWYRFHRGPLMQVGNKYCEVTQMLEKVSGRRQFGKKRFVSLFYDDSRKVAPQDLRWVIGIWEADLNAVEKAALVKAGFKRFELEGGGAHGIRTNWRLRPLCWRLSISAMITSCYPVLYEYCEEHKLKAGTRIEIAGFARRGFYGDYIPMGIDLLYDDKYLVDEMKDPSGHKIPVLKNKNCERVLNFFESQLAKNTRFPKLFRLSTRSAVGG